MKSEFSNKLKSAVQNQIPFVLFRKPDEKKVWMYVEDASESHRFLMHSFDSKVEKSISDANPIFLDLDEFDFEDELNLNSAPDTQPKTQSEYETLIRETIQEIKKSEIRKIVISRRKEIKNTGFNLLKSYKNLLNLHPQAWVYLWHHPGQETWMAATPELLLSQNGEEVKTVSLAGTRRPEVEWTEKEYDEQKIVTDFILENFTGIQNLEVHGPETVQAGKFLHLKTFIAAQKAKDFDLKQVLENLHPTPAVCGLPKMEAFEFILNKEGYDRAFYAGYLGIEKDEQKEYFVNLRCAQIFKDKIWIYVGGGITADSDPEKEWLETELKSGTILNGLA